jgi:hypothetical protein
MQFVIIFLLSIYPRQQLPTVYQVQVFSLVQVLLSGGSFDPAAAGPGPHIITYTYTGTNTCVNSATQTITVNPSPNANAGPDKFVLEGGVVTLTPTLFSGMQVSYTWSPPTYLSDANIANTIVQNPADDITYILRVVSDQGCFDTDDVFVKVLKAPVVPNAFSPNGDGHMINGILLSLNLIRMCDRCL